MKCGFTAENIAMIPFAEEEAAIIKADYLIDLSYKYFIVGACFSGARFISKDMGWEDTAKAFRDYEGVVSYFGGGSVTLYESILEDCVPVRCAFVD